MKGRMEQGAFRRKLSVWVRKNGGLEIRNKKS